MTGVAAPARHRSHRVGRQVSVDVQRDWVLAGTGAGWWPRGVVRAVRCPSPGGQRRPIIESLDSQQYVRESAEWTKR